MTAVKLALTSDLYLPVTPLERLADLAQQMAGFAPDAAVIAGDVAESLPDFTRAVQNFRQTLSCPIYLLPGDRDFWARPPYDSRRLWRELLPAATLAAGCEWLEGQAFVLHGVAVAGSVAWYDYSSALTAGMVSDLEFAQHKYEHSADALRIDWEWSDPEFAGQVSAALLATLDHLDQDPGVHAIVVVTHFPILEEQLVRQPGLGLASAYAGNLTLGRKVLPRRKVTHIVCGHTHVARHAVVQRSGLAPVDVHVVPGEHERPGWLGLTVEVPEKG